MNRHVAAGRLWTGSGLLSRRIRRRLAAWVRRGRRDDLTGWQAVIGCIVRAGLLLLVAYLLVRIVRVIPAVLWLITPLWCVLAYRAALPGKAAPAPAAEPPTAAPEATPEPFARWLLHTIGQRPGIHLRELYPAMRALPGQEGRSEDELRAGLRALGVPVVRSLRVGGIAGRSGVRRTDVQALLSPAESRPGEWAGDAGQAQDSPVLSTVGEGAESA